MPLTIKRNSKTINVKVTTMDAELDFNIEEHWTGRRLLDTVCKTIGIRENWYFGFKYTDSKGYKAWLKMDKKVLHNDIPPHLVPIQLQFLIKFYPEEISELIQEVTTHLLFLQVKKQIIDEEIYCPAEASVLLASYALQAKYGDYENYHSGGLLSEEKLMPSKVLHQYQMTSEMWEEKITACYVQHAGMFRDEADMEYLKIAQDLEMYGISYFQIQNKKDSELWLGIDALGLNIYEIDNRLTAKISFPWSEIAHVSYRDKKFAIKHLDRTSPDFLFYTEKSRVNKIILDLCIGNHDLFVRRRRIDSMEVQQMKAQAKEEKARKQLERGRLVREIQLREEAVRERTDLERRLQLLQAEVSQANEGLMHYEQTTELLAEKGRIAEQESILLAQKAAEAEHEISRIKLSAIKTEEEKQVIERKAFEAEIRAARMAEDAERRALEADTLKEELISARESEKKAKETLIAVTRNQFAVFNTSSEEQAVGGETDPGQGGAGRSCEGVRSCSYPLPSSASCVDNTAVSDNSDMEKLSLEIERERLEYIAKTEHLNAQLSRLRDEIGVLRVDEKLTPMDQIYNNNLLNGNTKCNTLRRQGLLNRGRTGSRYQTR